MPGKLKVMTTKKDFINYMNNYKLADILKVKGITGAAIENRGPGVDNKSLTELFKIASLYCTSAVRTIETKPAVADTNESIIVPGFPKPNGLPQPNPFNGPERDLVNFKRMVRFEDPPKMRYLFVPEKWFEVFYEKTGVTGPYVLAAGITTFVLSKEIWVVDHEFPYVLATIGVFYVGWKKFGASLANFLDKEIHEYEASCNAFRKGEIHSLKKIIEDQKIEVRRTEAEKHVIQAKRENIAIQLEAVRRERAIQAYNQVKRRLDYQVDLANLTRKVQHQFMVNWIVDNVKSAINEKDNFKKCMEDLQTLAAK
ncbi:ATP synthase subunit b, mitochondrial-like [Metopolophium dirhodum]|uniref:ATP synthase subunit b, mitochondrial-like n=1 Tax=Metopolophium dirhodum TaxID=44670 RepID=UPI00298F807C|nr:ATP synthase subunit b, mitochondrial-like [Metopolophium dirhodum]